MKSLKRFLVSTSFPIDFSPGMMDLRYSTLPKVLFDKPICAQPKREPKEKEDAVPFQRHPVGPLGCPLSQEILKLQHVNSNFGFDLTISSDA